MVGGVGFILGWDKPCWEGVHVEAARVVMGLGARGYGMGAGIQYRY